MVKLNESDERLFAELREALNGFLAQLSPVTERFSPLDVTVRKLLSQRLSSSDMTVAVAVLGNAGSGKSTFVNAIAGQFCLPDKTLDTLLVYPAKDLPAVLRTSKGKCVALGAEQIRKQLVDERTIRVPELLTRAMHTKLLESGECYAAAWHLIDNPPQVSAICPKLSSVASRTYSPNEFVADVIFYCVDARELGTERERHVFDKLIVLSPEERGSPHPSNNTATPISSRQRLKQCLFLVLTHMDAITDYEECMANIHAKEPPALKTTQAVFDRFYDLCEDVFDEPFPEDRVLIMNCRGAMMAKNVLRKFTTVNVDTESGAADMPDERPTVAELYDYSEAFFGSAFMQSIDKMPLEDLQKLVVHHAWFQGIVKTGAVQIDRVIAILDFNSARHLMTSVAVAASEVADTLRAALGYGRVTLERELETSLEHVSLLEAELEWVHRSIDLIQSAAQNMMSEVSKVSDTVMQRFCLRRLEELGYVLDHQGLEWFMSRQIGVVVDMKSSLNKLEQFTAKYLQQRQYLHDKMAHDAAAESCRSSEFGDSFNNTDQDNPQANAAAEFLSHHMDSILATMEDEKRDQILPLYTRFGHLIRDEFEHLFDEIAAEINQTRDKNVDSFFETCKAPVEQTQLRTHNVLDLESAARTLKMIPLVERNSRRLNNFVRELPEHVASAAVGIASDEYQQELALRQAQEEDEDRDSVIRGVKIRNVAIPPPGSAEMSRHLGYLKEAWRLALLTLGVDQISTFRFEELAEAVGRVSSELVEYLSGYATSIREGLDDQRQQVERIGLEIKEATEKVAKIQRYVKEFDSIRSELDLVNATNATDVQHARLVERFQGGTRRRSMEETQAPRRRASMLMPSDRL